MKRHRWLCLVVGLAVLLALHRPILHGVAKGLVVDDPIEQCDTLFVVSGDRNYAVAAELFAKNKGRQVVLLQGPIRPLVQCQIVAPGYEIARREIVKRGVPSQAISVSPGEIWSIWDIADRVGERLAEKPQQRIAVLADVFNTRRLRLTFERTLTDQQLSHVHILAIRDRRFDETNWWRSRLGIKEIVNAYVRGIHTALAGRPQRFSPPAGTLEALEQRLLAGSQAAR